MDNLTHRERVTAVFNHQKPDRLPMDLMGNACMLMDQTYLNLRDYLGLSPIPPVRQGTTANYYDERILEHLDIDFRRIFLKKTPGNKIRQEKDDIFSDIWGIRYKRLGELVNVIDHPFAKVTTTQEIENYRWPIIDELFTNKGLKEEAERLFNHTDYALVARNPLPSGFLEHACSMMGMSEFMLAMISEPEVAKSLINKLLELFKNIYTIFLDAVGPYVQMVEISDDLGSQNNLMISPEMYREFIKPAEQELYALIHEKAPNAALFHHTDGAVFDLIPDLIEVGVNVLNPVQTSSRGMDANRLKNTFGDKITFHGAIENLIKSKSSEEIAAEVKSRIDTLGKNGGYIIAPCNHVMDVRPENLLLVYDTAKKYGKYSS